MEEYKQIIDFDNYEVSNLGNVRNIKTGRILKGKDDTHGYLKVGLCKDKKKTNKKIHRLVAEAFIENPENKPCVDHIDNNKKNNDITNLRFATVSENNQNSKCLFFSTFIYSVNFHCFLAHLSSAKTN